MTASSPKSGQTGTKRPANRGRAPGVAPEVRAERPRPAATPPAGGSGTGIVPFDTMTTMIDRLTRANMARMTAGVSPAALAGAYLDWFAHLATEPGKQMQLGHKAWQNWVQLSRYAATCAGTRYRARPCVTPPATDRRFRHEGWQKWPYNLYHQQFLLNQRWWNDVTTGVRGVTDRHERVMEFVARQMLDAFSPSNFPATNPEVLERTRKEGGRNLARGFGIFLDDLDRQLRDKPPTGAEAFRPGHEVAATPGKVIHRNRLMELIQYSPTTGKVNPEPVLIVPAWIMKYYILDLSERNSMVKFLVDRGHTVFMVSWRNPDAEDRDLGMDDYRRMGVLDAVEAVQAVVPGRKIHGVGYCLGGTLLSIAAAAMGRDGEDPFATLTFLASQIDFTEAGELQLFTSESQVTYLEDMMWDQGYLDARQMTGAFQIMGSVDLIWSRVMRSYLMGEEPPMFDLMAWNADGTRMPYRMHSEYLRSLYLDNDLTEGNYAVDGRPVSVVDIRPPVFAVGTVTDHVAPWQSVYKMHLFLDTDVTFVLTSGGHNAGIVSEPGHPRRTYRIATARHDDTYVDPETWQAQTPEQDGSWWLEWDDWLKERSGAPVAPPAMGAPDAGFAPLADAPGTYVLQK